jgi:hypothetical protein
VVAELVRANGLEAKPDQIKQHIDELAASYERPADVVRWYYGDNRRLAEVEAIVIENNVTDYILSKAKTVEKQMEFRRADGTAGVIAAELGLHPSLRRCGNRDGAGWSCERLPRPHLPFRLKYSQPTEPISP